MVSSTWPYSYIVFSKRNYTMQLSTRNYRITWFKLFIYKKRKIDLNLRYLLTEILSVINCFDKLEIVFFNVCPRSFDQFYVVTHYMKWVKTSWTYSTGLRQTRIIVSYYHLNIYILTIFLECRIDRSSLR